MQAESLSLSRLSDSLIDTLEMCSCNLVCRLVCQALPRATGRKVGRSDGGERELIALHMHILHHRMDLTDCRVLHQNSIPPPRQIKETKPSGSSQVSQNHLRHK